MLSIPRAVTAALWRQEMQNQYDVTIITVRPATHLKALSVLEHGLANDPALLAC